MGKLGENIKRIREGMGLSQRQFGELIGKSDSQIWSYENDRTDILASTLYKIAEVANVDFNNLNPGGRTGERTRFGVGCRAEDL